MAKGTHKPCIQANVIEDKEAKLNKEELTSISLTMLSGGLDTVTTLVAWSIALLGQRPDIQEKAIREIRKIFSEDEILCAPEDEMKCEYVMALVKECLRYVKAELMLGRVLTHDKQILYGLTIGSSSSYCQRHHIQRQADSSGNDDISQCVGVQHGPSCVEGPRGIQTREMAGAARRTSVHVRSRISNVCRKFAGEQRAVSCVHEDAELLRDRKRNRGRNSPSQGQFGPNKLGFAATSLRGQV